MTKSQVITLFLVGTTCFFAGQYSVSKDLKVASIDQGKDLQSLMDAQSYQLEENSGSEDDEEEYVPRWRRNNHDSNINTRGNRGSDDEEEGSDSDEEERPLIGRGDHDYKRFTDGNDGERPLLGRGDHDYNRFTRGTQDSDDIGPQIGGGDHDYNRFTRGDEDYNEEGDLYDQEESDWEEDSESIDLNENTFDEPELINLRNSSTQRSRKIRSSKVDRFVDLAFKSVDITVDFQGVTKSKAQSILKKLLRTFNKSSLYSQKKFDSAWKQSDRNTDNFMDSEETKDCLKNFLNQIKRLNDDNKSFKSKQN